jgi:hypothetical protein
LRERQRRHASRRAESDDDDVRGLEPSTSIPK